jgi:hypothetical protein
MIILYLTRVRPFFEKPENWNSQKKPSESVFYNVRLNLQLKACMMLLAKDFSINNLITMYKSISIPISHKIQFASISTTNTQYKLSAKTQACQLFQTSAVLVPVLTCLLFDPLSHSCLFKFGFPVFYWKQHCIILFFKKHCFFSVYQLFVSPYI